MSEGHALIAIVSTLCVQFGYKVSEVIGRNVSMLMPDDIAKYHQGYIDRYLASGERARGRAVGKNRKV